MKFSIYLFILSLLFTGHLSAQETDKVLLTINKKPVFTSEFMRVYEKNKDIVIDNQSKDIKEYLDLQGRFRHLKPEDLEYIENRVHANFEKLRAKARMTAQEYLDHPLGERAHLPGGQGARQRYPCRAAGTGLCHPLPG